MRDEVKEGYCLEHTTPKMLTIPSKCNVLFLFSDGEPDRMLKKTGTIQQPEFDYRFTTEQLRRQSLKHSRNWFSALVLLLAIVATVCAYAGIPYQPYVATGIAALGIVVVLAMKNWEGRS